MSFNYRRVRRLRRLLLAQRRRAAAVATAVVVSTGVLATPSPAATVDPECSARGYTNCAGLDFHPKGIINEARNGSDLPVLRPEAHCGMVQPRYLATYHGVVLVCS